MGSECIGCGAGQFGWYLSFGDFVYAGWYLVYPYNKGQRYFVWLLYLDLHISSEIQIIIVTGHYSITKQLLSLSNSICMWDHGSITVSDSSPHHQECPQQATSNDVFIFGKDLVTCTCLRDQMKDCISRCVLYL